MSQAKLIEVIETTDYRGDGTEADPYRSVVQYWTKDGQLLAENDPTPINQQHREGGK